MKNILVSFLTILNEMSPYILLGFLIAGLLHVFVRPEVMARLLSGRGWKPVTFLLRITSEHNTKLRSIIILS